LLSKAEIIAAIETAFQSVKYPGDSCLRNSNEGTEPFLLEDEFKGKDNRAELDPAFLDQAPDGFSSALSFFSAEAFRFYLPAYLIADLRGQLESADPTFHLGHGLYSASANTKINPARYGERTWGDYAKHRWSMFTPQQLLAIRLYLDHKLEEDQVDYFVEEAMVTFWWPITGDA